MTWLESLRAWLRGENIATLRVQLNVLQGQVRDLRSELRIARAYIGELDQARLRYIAALEKSVLSNQTVREALKDLKAPAKPEPRKMGLA